MWETPFDVSMLTASNGVVIHCPEADLAEELFDIFKENNVGTNWGLGSTQWSGYKERTSYFYRDGQLLYGPKEHAERLGRFSGYTKCTFYGRETPDFDAASDDELCALFGA